MIAGCCLIRDARPPGHTRATAYECPGKSMSVHPSADAMLLILGVGGHIRLQLSKLSRDVVADQSGWAQHLANLDPGGAELTQGSAEPLSRGEGARFGSANTSNKRGAKPGVEGRLQSRRLAE
jgi:hypothetical protein